MEEGYRRVPELSFLKKKVKIKHVPYHVCMLIISDDENNPNRNMHNLLSSVFNRR